MKKMQETKQTRFYMWKLGKKGLVGAAIMMTLLGSYQAADFLSDNLVNRQHIAPVNSKPLYKSSAGDVNSSWPKIDTTLFGSYQITGFLFGNSNAQLTDKVSANVVNGQQVGSVKGLLLYKSKADGVRSGTQE